MPHTDHQARLLAWDACYNVRDVGGYPAEAGRRVRWRTLVRADDLCRLTPDGQATLCDYGVRTIIDLRLAHELEKDPNPFAGRLASDGNDAPRYLHLPLFDPETAHALQAEDSLRSEYIVILEKHKADVAAAIKAVSAGLEEGGVVVHCHGGKDRTGIVVALLLSLVGVPGEIIAEDYSLSEGLLEPVHQAWLEEQSQAEGQPVERPRWMSSRPETLLGVLDYLDRTYGSVQAYLQAAGVTQAEIALVRQHLLEP